MDQVKKIRSIIILVEGLDLNQDTQTSDKFPCLQKVISEGNSTLVVDENPISAKNPLVSVLTFSKTFREGIKTDTTVTEGSAKFFENTQVGQKSKDGDEEVIEVRYVSHPQKLSEVTEASIFVVTNSEETAQFCEVGNVNYLYKKGESKIDQIKSEIGNKTIDLLILHRKDTDATKEETLIWIEEFLGLNSADFEFLRIIFSPFGKSLQKEKVLQAHQHQISANNNEIQDAMKSIIPNQTWQYYRGNVTLKKEEIENIMLMITNRKGLNRADKIEKIEDFTLEENIVKFGGRVIHSFGVLREILFEIGKLPKFGA